MRIKSFCSIAGALILALLLWVGVSPGDAGANPTLKPIEAKNLEGPHDCVDNEWHFVITQIDVEANAPASIHVEWANGYSEELPLSDFTGGTAHYLTTTVVDSTVSKATADIYSSWSGNFNLSHVPCEVPTETPTDTPTDTATATDTPEDTPTDTATATETPVNTPTDTATSTDTPENTPTDTATSTIEPCTNRPGSPPCPTDTPTVTDTPTSTATETPVDTATIEPCTNRPGSATCTPTPTETSTSTSTPEEDTPTATETQEASVTTTSTATAVDTPTPVKTPVTKLPDTGIGPEESSDSSGLPGILPVAGLLLITVLTLGVRLRRRLTDDNS